MQNAAYQEYKKQSVMTMTPADMLIKLYDECLAMLQLGVMYMDENNIEQRFESLKKAREILCYLREILNMDYEISQNLFALYEYYITQIVDANTHVKKEPILEVIEMLTELRDSFVEADKMTRKPPQQTTTPVSVIMQG